MVSVRKVTPEQSPDRPEHIRYRGHQATLHGTESDFFDHLRQEKRKPEIGCQVGEIDEGESQDSQVDEGAPEGHPMGGLDGLLLFIERLFKPSLLILAKPASFARTVR